MSEATSFIIGSEVSCSDGVCGDLRRVVVDPVARVITHLVVEPRHRHGTGHLVPIGLAVAPASGHEIRLRCTTSEFHALEDAEETQFLPGPGGDWGYEPHQMLSWPYYGLAGGMGIGGMGIGGVGIGGVGTGVIGMGAGPHAVITDRVPVGEVEVRRGEHVDATDGAIGRIQGLVVDPADHHVTHVLLEQGHLWGQKTVGVPIGAVTRVGEVIRLNLTKDEVRDLPPLDVDSPA